MRVICDTNVWYEFAKGKIDPSIAKNYELVITNLSLVEIVTSENLIYDIILVKRTLLKVKELASQIIRENPFDYILKLHSPKHEPDYSNVDFTLKEIQKFMQIDDDILINESAKIDFQKLVIQWDSEISELSTILNALIPEINRNIKTTSNKYVHRRLETEDQIRELVKKMLESAIKKFNFKIAVDWNSFPWEKIGLLTRTWDIYFKDIELSGRTKFNKNDWVDILNLAYVEPGMKYWTFENKWNRIFERDTQLTSYRFEII